MVDPELAPRGLSPLADAARRADAFLASSSSERLVHELFEDRVRDKPDAIAVTCGDINLTYRQLDDRANALALRLRRANRVEPGTPVCLVLERSEHVLVSMLAVLKAGGAYAPIAPDSPDRRIELILQETGSPVVLTDVAHQRRLEDLVRGGDLAIGVLAVDDEAADPPPAGAEPINRGLLGPNSLAYVIYTSGTSGRPKGVMIEHRSAVNYVANAHERLNLSDEDTSGYSTNIGFDLTVTTTLACLALGGRVAVYTGEARDVDCYRSFLTEHKVTFIKLTPSYFGLVAGSLHDTNVRTVVLGGEKLGRAVLERIRTRADQELTVYDEYGPTEATVGACSALAYPLPADQALNIGLMYDNYRGHVLGPEMRPVPAGEVGELFIGGLGVARGYLNRPDLTAERFVDDPFSTGKGIGDIVVGSAARLYRTGDLVRQLPGGELEYLVRNDDQVKIRGFRVEPGEIEYAIESYGDVEQAVILARTVGIEKEVRGLIAYVVPGEFGCSEEALVEHLREKLPDYLLPTAYVFLDELPLTSNGKVDRAALPKPEHTSSDELVAPRTDLERAVAQIWTDLLGHEGRPIGVTDDFIRLGGDSIVAIQLLGRVRQRFGVHLPVRELLERGTVERFCELVGEHLAGQRRRAEGDREIGEAVGEVSLLPIQQWFFDGDFTRPNHWNQAFLIATLPLDVERLRERVIELGNRHGAFRLRYRRGADGQIVQFHADDHQPTELVVASVAELEDLSAQLTAWQADFDVQKGPVYRVGYVHGFADGSARVFVACHHLVVDAVSWRILTEDLEALYQDDSLPPMGSTYGQWTAAVEQYASRHPDEQAYWQRIQSEYEQSGDAALRRLVQSDGTMTVSELNLDRDATQRLLKCHRAYQTQINDVLLAAFAHALTDLTGESVSHVILEGHGREDMDPRLDVGRTVGWFTTMFPVRLHTGTNRLATLRETKEILRSIPAKGIGYGAHYGYHDDRLPRINFNYLGRLDFAASSVDSGRWRLTREPAGDAVHPVNRDNNIMTINGWIVDGRLTFTVANKLGQDVGDRLVQLYECSLITLIDELFAAPRGYLTPSDIDHVVSAAYLDELQAEREIEGVYLANSLQQGFIYQAVSHSRDDDAYTVQITWTYDIQLNIDAMREAWTRAQRTFPALRLRFGWQEELVQIIDARGVMDWRFADLTDEPTDQQAASMQRLRKADRSEPYDLRFGSLFRVYLVRLGPARFTCLFSHHHSILDGWSITVLLSHVHESYEAFVAGLSSEVTPDRSYPSGQRYLQEHREDHNEFWRDYLAHYDERMDLQGLLGPDARSNGLRVGTTRRVRDMRELSFTLSGDELATLRQMARDCGVTLNALFLYVWHKTLASYTGAEKTITGVVLSGRGIPVDDIDRSVGLFISTLPLVVPGGTGHEIVLDGIRAIQRQINELNSRSTVNLAALNQGADRLFDTLFIYENWPKISPDGWQTRLAVRMGGEFEKLDYPLSVIVSDTPESIRFRLAYSAELFDDRYLSDMLEIQRNLLDEVLAHHERPWGEVALLSDQQYRQLNAVLNSSAGPTPALRSFVEEFAEQARRHPERTAVIYEETTLTYGALDEAVNRLANLLVDVHGVQPEQLVVLCLDKGPDLLLSILAVLKAGAAYVLVNPAYPDTHLRYILEDTGTHVVITASEYRGRVAELGAAGRVAAVLALDALVVRDALSAASPTVPAVPIGADSLMYVLYTSGTTGVPKGVMIEHRSFALILAGVKDRYFSDRESLSTYSLTSHVFDIFGLEYGLPLFTGGSVTLAPDVPTTLDCGGYDFVQMTSSVCHLMLDRLANLPADLLLLVGGEKLPRELLNRVLAKSIDIANVYGPTETTIWSTSHLYRHINATGNEPVSIGTPFVGESVHILDGSLRPLPIGAVGELCIGGGGLARGYLNKTDLTDERFVTLPDDPASHPRVGRLYRTGDLVRLLPSGTLEFVGRNDSQVKIDGHRIEIGEVDAALASHPAVRQSVIVPLQLSSTVLVGYFVADREIPEDELTEHLRRFLPAYMVPVRCVHLEEMPLTINGKLDRGALPRPDIAGARSHLPPRSRIEADLCAVMARVLGHDPLDVGVDDDFFRLGGTSLLSIKLVMALERELGISTTVAYLLEHRTVRKLVDYLDDGRDQGVVIPQAVFAGPEDQRMSFAQERLWFIDRFEGGTSAYNLPLVFQVADRVDTGTLVEAVRAVIARHDVLRTLLKKTSDGTGYQEVLDAERPIEVEVVHLPDRAAMQTEMRRDVERVFDLEREAPVRVRLYDVPDVGRHLAFIIHHVAFDGWSTDVLLEDLTTAHDRLMAQSSLGAAPLAVLPTPQLSYRDFAVWQRGYLTGERLERMTRYWEDKLEDYHNLDLVPDRPRPDSPDYRGADIRLPIELDVSRGLRQLAEELGVSLFSLLLSAHFLTLRCFSNQDDIVVGTPVANRDHPQLARIIGCFVNTLPLRSRIDGEARIVDYVRETGREVLGLLRQQELPFERLLEILNVDRDVSRHPIFQVTFGVQGFGAPPMGTADSSEPILRTARETQELYTAARFDLSTFVDDSHEALELCVVYATSLFEQPTVDSFSQTYLTLLRQFADLAGNEDRQRTAALSDLVYLDPVGHEQMVKEWSAPRQCHRSDMLLHRSVEEHARRSPGRVALVREEHMLTYQKLNAASNRLAHHLLRGAKIEPNAIVMLCLDRGDDIATSILGTLKAGGCYLPVDPTYPDDRIAFMLADAGVRTVVTSARYAGRFAAILDQAALDGIDVIAVDVPAARALIDAAPDTNPSTAVAPDDLAYVLYTSGTTGKPKGVPQTHGNVARLFTALENIYDIRKDDVWTLFHNYVFDFTVWEMWGAFLYGGRLVVPTFEETRDPKLFYQLCRRERVTMLCQTPTAFYQFVNVALSMGDDERVDELRYVFFGGEALNVSLLGGWFERYGHRRPLLAMGYGTTETTVFTCYKIYDETDERSTDIGSLIPDVAGYVLDTHLRPLPMGAVGELHIGGAGLAPGYLNLPSLTSSKFVANPFDGILAQQNASDLARVENARLYKSGDLVRWAPNRTLRFVGRNDLQVKIRGHRIELGEIETVLSGAPGVLQCAVVVRKTSDGGAGSHLVGYYVAEPYVGSSMLFEHLRAKLPSYMIPAALVPMDELPRKISGKLDVNALPAPRLDTTREIVAPRNERQGKALRVLAEILCADVEALSIHDNFFELGGNSILSIKLASRLSVELGVDVDVVAIFRHGSVAGLVDSLGTGRTKLDRIPRAPERPDTEQVLSFQQESLWFVDRYEGGTDAYNIYLCYEVVPGVAVDVLEDGFRAVYKRHEVLRTVIRQRTDGELYQSVLDPRVIPLPVSYATVSDTDDLAVRVRADAKRTFDLANEPPFRITFYREAAEDGSHGRAFVGIFAHHIAFDGWSADVLMRELERFYTHSGQVRDGAATPGLPESAIRYRDYSAWQRERLSGDRLQELLGYWKARLRGRKPLNLPLDCARPPRMDDRGDRLVFTIEVDTSLALRRLASQAGVGLFSVLLSAYYLMLQAFTGRGDLLVGVPVANRSHGQTHDLIGCFINSLALDFEIDSDDDVLTLIKKVGARVAEAQDHQELPFQRLVAELNLPVDTSRHPLFQVWFDFHSFAHTGSDRAAGAVLLRNHDLDGDSSDGAAATKKLDLGLLMNSAGESLVGTITYAAILFERPTVESFASVYRTILMQFARLS